MKIAVSACLMGDNVRYNGSNTFNEELVKILSGHEIIKICPECEAGLPVPRNPIEISDGRIIDREGKNYTQILDHANQNILKMIRSCDLCILKLKSPTCGYTKIYDGSFTGKLIEGNGSFAGLCIENGIVVFNEEQLNDIRFFINKKLAQ